MGYNITKEEAEEAYSLVKRAVPSANGTEGSEHAIDEWSDEEKALFVKATEASYHLWYRSNFLICDALKPLNGDQIRFLLKHGLSELEDEVVGMQGVEELEERLPLAGLDGLASIIPETEMHRSGTIEGVEDLVDGLGRKWSIGGITGNIGFIYLQARAGAA